MVDSVGDWNDMNESVFRKTKENFRKTKENAELRTELDRREEKLRKEFTNQIESLERRMEARIKRHAITLAKEFNTNRMGILIPTLFLLIPTLFYLLTWIISLKNTPM